MRRRSVQLSILIVVIVAISVAALGFRDININVPGFPALVRGGDGPLGLKLGLGPQRRRPPGVPGGYRHPYGGWLCRPHSRRGD